MSTFSNIVTLFLCAIALVTHLLRMVNVLFKPAWLQRMAWLSEPSKTQMFLYYLLVAGASYYGIAYALGRLL
jgi:hypothetical protein